VRLQYQKERAISNDRSFFVQISVKTQSVDETMLLHCHLWQRQ